MRRSIYNPSNRKVECICPRCGARHRLALFWTGRGTPRKYCADCAYAAAVIYRQTDPALPVMLPGKRTIGRG